MINGLAGLAALRPLLDSGYHTLTNVKDFFGLARQGFLPSKIVSV